MGTGGYTGRFAPSPTGALHAGSMVAALASWLDARAHGGRWLVRIEDVDTPRCSARATQEILRQLAACGLLPDQPPWFQSQRDAAYAAALQTLIDCDHAYGCACTRRDIEAALQAQGVPHERHGERVYPGTCRPQDGDPSGGLQGRAPRAWRLHTAPGGVVLPPVEWHDRRLGPQRQDVAREVGDFVLKRADGLWAYQLAVVVDDAAQGVTHIVRGEDLADNTARQILLQRALGCATPVYLHTPLVRAADGHKLSKQNGAAAVDVSAPVRVLREAAAALELPLPASATTLADTLAAAVAAWAQKGRRDGMIAPSVFPSP